MVLNNYRYTVWCRINRSMVGYIASSSDLQRNEGLLISHPVVTNRDVSLQLRSMKPTRAWEKVTLITDIPPFFVICSNSYTRILDRGSSSSASMTLTIIKGIWYNITRTQRELYPAWRLARLRILPNGCACTTLQPQSRGGQWVEQQQSWLLLSSLYKHIVLLRIRNAVNDHYLSNHSTGLLVPDDHCVRIPLARKLTYSLYEDDLPSFSAAQRLQRRYNSQCRNDLV